MGATEGTKISGSISARERRRIRMVAVLVAEATAGEAVETCLEASTPLRSLLREGTGEFGDWRK